MDACMRHVSFSRHVYIVLLEQLDIAAATFEPSPSLLHSPTLLGSSQTVAASPPMDQGPHHPPTYHHDDDGYPFLPDGDGQPRNPAAGEPSDGGDTLLFLAVPAGWLVRVVAFLGERVGSAVLGLLVLPVAALIGELRAVPAAAASLARRAAVGMLAAAFTFAALCAAFVVSLLLGFFLVRYWVEEPVTVRQPLYFDYTEPQPSAAVALGGARDAGAALLPAGHSVGVSMALLLPDSDHNRQMGVFQIKAEAISTSGSTIASTTQPYMLRYKSPPVRLAQSALTIVVLAMGVRSESQTATLKILQYGEGHGRHKRTGLIRVYLQPKAMTVQLPQVYRAEIVVQTALPWTKALARSLKWTLCVWVSSSVYVVFSVLAICWVRPLSLSAWDRRLSGHLVDGKAIANLGGRDFGQSSHTELSGGVVVKWRERRGKSKARHRTIYDGRVELRLDEASASNAAAVATDEAIDDSEEPLCAPSSMCEFS